MHISESYMRLNQRSIASVHVIILPPPEPSVNRRDRILRDSGYAVTQGVANGLTQKWTEQPHSKHQKSTKCEGREGLLYNLLYRRKKEYKGEFKDRTCASCTQVGDSAPTASGACWLTWGDFRRAGIGNTAAGWYNTCVIHYAGSSKEDNR